MTTKPPPPKKTNWAAVSGAAAVASALVAFLAYADPHNPPTPNPPTPPTSSQASPTSATPPLSTYTPYTPPLPVYTAPLPTYTTPTMYYGAIAISSDGTTGKSYNADSAAAASQQARDNCPRSDCTLIAQFVNSCAAVAYNPSTGRYWAGHGATATEAEDHAISNAGGGHSIGWACTTR